MSSKSSFFKDKRAIAAIAAGLLILSVIFSSEELALLARTLLGW